MKYIEGRVTMLSIIVFPSQFFLIMLCVDRHVQTGSIFSTTADCQIASICVVRSGYLTNFYENDTYEVFALDNNSNMTKQSKQISFVKGDELNHASVVNDDVSKRNISYIIELQPPKLWQARSDIAFNVYGIEKSQVKAIWLTKLRSNDHYVSFQAEKIDVPTSDLQCEMDKITAHTKQFKNGKWNVYVAIKSTTSCNTDMDNVNFQLYTESSLEVLNVTHGDDCIAITNTEKLGNVYAIKYKRYYALQMICFDVTIAVKDKVHTQFGSKLVHVLIDVVYKEIRNDTVTIQNQMKMVSATVNDEETRKKGICIKFNDGCLYKNTPNKYMRSVSPISKKKSHMVSEYYPSFKQTAHQLKHSNGKCVEVDDLGAFLVDCINSKTSFKWMKNKLYVNGTKTMMKAFSIVKATSSSALLVVRRYENKYGIYKNKFVNESNKDSRSDLITFIAYQSIKFVCIWFQNRTDSKCLIYQGSSFSKVVHRLSIILAYDTYNNIIYGKDKTGSILSVYLDNKYDKVISPSSWKQIQSTRNESLIFSRSVERDQLMNEFVNIDTTSITYYGISVGDEHKVIWPSDVNCVNNIATTKHTALKSCNEIKKMCVDAKSKTYWINKNRIKATNVMEAGQVYCDMDTDKGGWMLIFNYTTRNAAIPSTFTKFSTADVFDVVSTNYYKMVFLDRALRNIASSFGAITEMRFYCTTSNYKRTIHLTTLRNFGGNNYLSYLLNLVDRSGNACTTYNTYEDDDSKLTENCKLFGDSGEWTSQGRSATRISNAPFRVSHEYYYSPKHHLCDNPNTDKEIIKFGNWKIYVRNK